MKIEKSVALITGAASGIGQAVAVELARRGASHLALVDFSENVRQLATTINEFVGPTVAAAHIGDVTNDLFRQDVFNLTQEKFGPVTICVPAAGITRDAISVKVDKASRAVTVYPVDTFRKVLEVNLVAPTYWALEMVAGIARDRLARNLGRWNPETEHIQGTVIFIGSVSSLGNKGQISYAATKAGLEGVAATLMAESMYHGVRCGVIHPGFTDTPMVRSLGEDYIRSKVLPQTQLGRLIKPEEIADAICFLITNSAVSGELWADAGWRPAV